MASTLPDNPSQDLLRGAARTLQRAVRGSDAAAVAQVRRHHPRPGVALAVLEEFALPDAQLTVARGYGFEGWPALIGYLAVVAQAGADPGAVDPSTLAVADRFCSLAALHYDDTDVPPRFRSAAGVLEENPDLVHDHVWAAAAAHDPEALERILTHNGRAAAVAGGPFRWPPLLYLCYSRVPLRRTESEVLGAVSLLLDAGADPNAGYLWRSMSTPFTALTGVFGEGEQGPRRQPRHPHAPALARLLLERGAHPVDHQTLYNRMFRADDSHLDMLFEFGLADVGPSPWEQRLGTAMETRAQMWRRQIDWDAEHGFTARLELLARHGVDVSGVDVSGVEARVWSLPADPNIGDEAGATPLHHAAWAGDLDGIHRLLDAGADPSLIDDRFGATPQGWAEHAYQTEAAALLRDSSTPNGDLRS